MGSWVRLGMRRLVGTRLGMGRLLVAVLVRLVLV